MPRLFKCCQLADVAETDRDNLKALISYLDEKIAAIELTQPLIALNPNHIEETWDKDKIITAVEGLLTPTHGRYPIPHHNQLKSRDKDVMTQSLILMALLRRKGQLMMASLGSRSDFQKSDYSANFPDYWKVADKKAQKAIARFQEVFGCTALSKEAIAARLKLIHLVKKSIARIRQSEKEKSLDSDKPYQDEPEYFTPAHLMY